MKTKLLSLILIMAMLITLVACSHDAPEETSDNQAITTAPSENSDENDDLPESLNTAYQGRTFRILSSLGWNQESADPNDHKVLIHEDMSNVYSNAVFKRNSAVKSRFGIEITEVCKAYDNDNHTGATNQVRANHSSGTDEFDLVSLVDRDMVSLICEGIIYYADEIENINLDKAYWNQLLNESMTIKNRQLIAYGDASITAYDMTNVLIYNKKMVTENKLGDLYEIVEADEWTWEKFYEMASQVAVNVGEAEWDENDTYGWLVVPKQANPIVWISSGALSISKNNQDVPQFDMENEKMLTLLNNVYAFTYGSGFWYENKINGTDVQDPPIFKEGRALFTSTTFGALFGGYYSTLDFDYGIIPHPKYDENQTSYYTRVEGGRPYGVPTILADTSFSGAVLEVLNCESRKIVMPEYYETCLKGQYSIDFKSAEVIDTLVAGRVYDLGDTIFSNSIRDKFVMNAFLDKRPVTSSIITANKNAVIGDMNKVIDYITPKS